MTVRRKPHCSVYNDITLTYIEILHSDPAEGFTSESRNYHGQTQGVCVRIPGKVYKVEPSKWHMAGQGNLVNRLLIMEIVKVTTWVIEVIDLLNKSP